MGTLFRAYTFSAQPAKDTSEASMRCVVGSMSEEATQEQPSEGILHQHYGIGPIQ